MISEIFYSVQGEVDVGKPSIFVRFSGCNLIRDKKACGWCDSLFAEKGQELSIEEVLQRVIMLKCRNVVITGGEPLYQLDGLRTLAWKLLDMKYNVTIETNGTLYDDILKYVNKISCSPKRQSINLTVIKKLAKLKSCRFKFVFEGRKNNWFEDVVEECKLFSNQVWIMPEGKTKKEQNEKMKMVIEYCKENFYHFTPRLQVLVWDKKRKV